MIVNFELYLLNNVPIINSDFLFIKYFTWNSIFYPLLANIIFPSLITVSIYSALLSSMINVLPLGTYTVSPGPGLGSNPQD